MAGCRRIMAISGLAATRDRIYARVFDWVARRGRRRVAFIALFHLVDNEREEGEDFCNDYFSLEIGNTGTQLQRSNDFEFSYARNR